MRFNRRKQVAWSVVAILLLVPLGGVIAQEQANGLAEFDPARFTHSTKIDNEWLPLKPGTRMTWSGYSVDEEGVEESHSLVCTVTDLIKVIGGVRTVVCWERDIVDRELEELLEERVRVVDQAFAHVVADVGEAGGERAHEAVDHRGASGGVARFEPEQVDLEDVVSHGLAP